MNNVNEMDTFITSIIADQSEAIKEKQVMGSWVFDEGKPQFVSKLAYGQGDITLFAELPPFAGGWGSSPDPVQYCLYGMAACFAATFAAAASSEGIQLKQLSVTAQNRMDLRKQMGLAGENIIEKVKFIVTAQGASNDELEKLVTLSKERCPGVECVTRMIPLEVELGS